MDAILTHSFSYTIFRAATTAMSQEDVLENVQAVVENAVPKIPGKWSNIRCISIKTPSSMSLPFYNKTPEELAVISKLAGIETNVEEVQVDQKEKKDAKRKLAAKSPLVQALKKQKKLETEEIEKSAVESVKKSEKKQKKKKRVVEVEVEETVVVEKRQKKKKRSMSAEIEVAKEIAVVEGSPKKKQNADFIASKKFKGSKQGYVFHRGKQGLGYYMDIKPVVDKMAMEALKRQATQQSRGGGRSGGSRKKGRKGRR